MDKTILKDNLEVLNKLLTKIREYKALEETEIKKLATIKMLDLMFVYCVKVIRQLLEYEGVIDFMGSKATFKQMQSFGYVDNINDWLEFVIIRKEISQCYEPEILNKVYSKVDFCTTLVSNFVERVTKSNTDIV